MSTEPRAGSTDRPRLVANIADDAYREDMIGRHGDAETAPWVTTYGTFWLTLVVVMVSGVAAYVSWRATRAAERSAEHSRAAAVAAAEATAVARAGLKALFRVEPALDHPTDGPLGLYGYWVSSEGDTFYVGQSQFDGVILRLPDGRSQHQLPVDPPYGDCMLSPDRGNPTLLHRGERVFYRVDPPFPLPSENRDELRDPNTVIGVAISIEYGLEPEGRRNVVWLAPTP